jgi:hypothetical protein
MVIYDWYKSQTKKIPRIQQGFRSKSSMTERLELEPLKFQQPLLVLWFCLFLCFKKN